MMYCHNQFTQDPQHLPKQKTPTTELPNTITTPANSLHVSSLLPALVIGGSDLLAVSLLSKHFKIKLS